MSIEDSQIEKKGHVYFSPHKYIVCLIGSGDYTVNQFELDSKGKLSKMPNLSISIAALSSVPVT